MRRRTSSWSPWTVGMGLLGTLGILSGAAIGDLWFREGVVIGCLVFLSILNIYAVQRAEQRVRADQAEKTGEAFLEYFARELAQPPTLNEREIGR